MAPDEASVLRGRDIKVEVEPNTGLYPERSIGIFWVNNGPWACLQAARTRKLSQEVRSMAAWLLFVTGTLLGARMCLVCEPPSGTIRDIDRIPSGDIVSMSCACGGV